MKPILSPPNCSGCNRPAELVPKLTRFRRGELVLPFDGYVWQCPWGCADPFDGAVPYQFSNLDLMQWEEQAAAAAWEARFGHPMPSPQRARRPEEQRTVRVPVLLTVAEAERLDELRGDRSRGEFLRQLLATPGRRVG
ncbi:hypothetical protein L6R53_00810 [Myxococcota bacterium]|nr:hypothetical protein [Myxococcota bacterium]